MPKFKEGDRVRVVTREPSEEDAKTNLYFGYYGGLTGTVAKVYDANEIALEIEPESLTKEIRKRHDDVRDQMKTKWLDGLSEEGRAKLTEREKDFNLRYRILLKSDDVEKAGPRPASAVKEVAPPAPRPAETTSARAEPEPHRKTLAELEAAEEEEFRRRQGG